MKFYKNNSYKADNRIVPEKASPPISIITNKNVSGAFIISFSFHVVVLLIALLFRADKSYIVNAEFMIFFFSDGILWTLCLVPLIAAFRKKIKWSDPYFLISLFIFIMIMTIYLAYLIDPHYVYLRINWGGIAFFEFSESLMLLRLSESEIIISIFVAIMLYINRHIPQGEHRDIIKQQELTCAGLTGIVCFILGLVGFMIYWSDKNLVESIVFQMGSPELSPEIGKGKFMGFQKWAIITLPLTMLGIIYIKPVSPLFRLLFVSRFSFIIFILISIMPMIVFGARIAIFYLIYAYIVILNRFGVKFKKTHLFCLVVIAFIIIYFMTLVRMNPKLDKYGNPFDVIKYFFKNPLSLYYEKSESPLFYIDRVGIIASIIQQLYITGDYSFGKTLLSGPYNQIAYIINKISNLNISEIINSTDLVCLWRMGYIPVWGKGPPSLIGEIYMQFGYWGLGPLFIGFAIFFRWLRKRQLGSTSLMQYWLFTIISIELLNSIGAEFGLIFRFLTFHIIPILMIYTIIHIFIYGWHRKYSKIKI